MKCLEVRETFGVYWDLAETDSERMAVDDHLVHCDDCREEFRLWEESEQLIRSLSELDEAIGPIEVDHVNRGVMERIYAEDSWFMPVPSRTYQFSRSFRRNAAAAIACCMAMFICGLFYMLIGNQDASSVEMAKLTGLIETANAAENTGLITADFYADLPVASISDPLVLNVVPTFPQYWIALSILGMIMALLILNWLSRTRQ
ncbi:anti-sigma factor family protein [Paenibacillus aurantiacus]|uniref:Anti-sigma factor family protein n=1 Tax=Paenibacillus aurantiacus TaxID=1936118 RepID=A0ABV5KXH3_9BACL